MFPTVWCLLKKTLQSIWTLWKTTKKWMERYWRSCEDPSRRDDTKLAIELLKIKVLTLETQLTEKDDLINVLYYKVNIAKKASIKIGKVSFSESRTDMTISNSNNSSNNNNNNNNDNDNSNTTVLNKNADVSSTFCKTCVLLYNFTKRQKTIGKSDTRHKRTFEKFLYEKRNRFYSQLKS